MPDSQKVCGSSGSYTIEVGMWSMLADPGPLPSATQVLPESSLANSPFFATPTMTRAEPGCAETIDRSPPPAASVVKLLVTLTQADEGATALFWPALPPSPPLLGAPLMPALGAVPAELPAPPALAAPLLGLPEPPGAVLAVPPTFAVSPPLPGT